MNASCVATTAGLVSARPRREGRSPCVLTMPWAAGAPPWAIARINRLVRLSKPVSHRKPE